MKILGWALVFLVLLASGCTGMLAGGEDSCRLENESYLDIAELDAKFLGLNRKMSWSQSLGYYMEAVLGLENQDQEGGWFLVSFDWRRPSQPTPYTEKKSLHLDPGEKGEFKSIIPDIDPNQQVFLSWSYDSYPDSKRLVTKQREKEVCG